MPPSLPAAEVAIVSPLSDPVWDQRIAGLARSSFFHQQAWARVLADTYGFRPLYFVLQREAQWIGALPLMQVDSWLTGRRGIALPFTDRCEPLCADQADFDQLLSRVSAYGAEQRWRHFELRGGRRWLGTGAASTVFHHHVLELQAGETTQFQMLDPAVRRACRKAERGGLKIEFSHSLESVRIFYSLLQKTRQRHGAPVQPFRFFENIHRHILAPQAGATVLARLDDTPVAGAMFFQAGNTVHYKFGGSDRDYQQHRANNLVLWHAIKRAAAGGYRFFDFGRTSVDNPGLRRFKASWGASESVLEYFRPLVPSGEFALAPDRAGGWQTHFFRLAPAFLSRAMGRALYRHVA